MQSREQLLLKSLSYNLSKPFPKEQGVSGAAAPFLTSKTTFNSHLLAPHLDLFSHTLPFFSTPLSV